MNLKFSTLFLIVLAIFVGALAALIAWTLIIKNQITATAAANPQLTTALNLIGSL